MTRRAAPEAVTTAEAYPYIASDLQALARPLSMFHESPSNARKHSLTQDLPVLMDSLRRFGQRKPIVARRGTGEIIAGNGTFRAAERLDWTHIAVAWFDGTDEEAQEYALLDNRTAELSEWDLPTLAAQLRAVQARSGEDGVVGVGWTMAEAGPLMQASWTPPEQTDMPGGEVSYKTVRFTLDQWRAIEDKIARLRTREQDAEMADGRAIELMVADFEPGD